MRLINQKFIFITIIFLQGCCTTKQVPCPDGRPVTYQKNIRCAEKAYKDAVKDFEINLKAAIDVLEKLNINIANLEVKNKSVLLKDKLNNESIRYQDALKSSYLALSYDPCTNSERHYKLLESLTQRNYDLLELRESLKNNTDVQDVNSKLNNYLYERGKREGKAMGLSLIHI